MTGRGGGGERWVNVRDEDGLHSVNLKRTSRTVKESEAFIILVNLPSTSKSMDVFKAEKQREADQSWRTYWTAH